MKDLLNCDDLCVTNMTLSFFVECQVKQQEKGLLSETTAIVIGNRVLVCQPIETMMEHNN